MGGVRRRQHQSVPEIAMHGFFCAIARFVVALVLTGVYGCGTAPKPAITQPLNKDSSSLEGWQTCAVDCGKNFVSAYNSFVFIRLDNKEVFGTRIEVTPGRHWVEAHYSWGVGILVGIGNYRNYGFEFEFAPGHRYRITETPDGCVVPLSLSWVSAKTLRIEDRLDDEKPIVHEVRAIERCSTFPDSGTCRTDADCQRTACTALLSGTSGYGLCGQPR